MGATAIVSRGQPRWRAQAIAWASAWRPSELPDGPGADLIKVIDDHDGELERDIERGPMFVGEVGPRCRDRSRGHDQHDGLFDTDGLFADVKTLASWLHRQLDQDATSLEAPVTGPYRSGRGNPFGV